MSPTGNKLITNPSSLANLHLNHCYKEASTSRWQLQALFQSFLEGRSADTLLAVQERRLLISWDLKAIHHLRRCLRAWILDQVPGDAIGAFLVTIFLCRGRSPEYTSPWQECLWMLRYHERFPPHIPTPLPADARWPLFMGALSDPELEDLMDRLGDGDDHAGGYSPPLFTGVREEDIPIIQAFRRFNLHKNDFSEDFPLPESRTDRIEHTSHQTNRLQDKPLPSIPIFTPVRKPLRAIPIDKALPHNPLLPLPPLSRPASPNFSSVRVSTFPSGMRPKVQGADCIPSGNANIEQRKDKTGLQSSATSRLKSTPSVNLNQQAPHPSDITYIPCYIHHNASPAPPRLKRKAALEDLRKAREQGG
ncbi:uncharacterized protein N7500_003204 [Penicillium coprophilum]|uniref:uncharacterized protein n=1 Tax=Penicillium coprophilum TaxID=36646 RepID=UPI0023929E6E|nr:uncharacterized protein N7500_003204 [Penicillium coprophilum]KAJ5170421.1 hypothetical protein N7500_003204 [Penicillium coprophilum]